MIPKLLVSVRDPAEARAALQGGCDVLDIKEPRHGALGRADWSIIGDIVTDISQVNHAHAPISAALGELSDWQQNLEPIPAAGQRALPTLQFVKLGLAGTRHRESWRDDYLEVIDSVRHITPLIRWIGVMYADWKSGDAPSPAELLETIDGLQQRHAVNFGGLLIDTYSKGDQRLLDFMSSSQLVELRQAAHARHLPLAVAGRLRQKDLPSVTAINPDIIAVRSAVCGSGDRMNTVTAQAVADFKANLQFTVTRII